MRASYSKPYLDLSHRVLVVAEAIFDVFSGFFNGVLAFIHTVGIIRSAFDAIGILIGRPLHRIGGIADKILGAAGIFTGFALNLITRISRSLPWNRRHLSMQVGFIVNKGNLQGSG